jgi:hypothetical protein
MGKGLHSEFSTVSEIPPAGNYQYAMAAWVHEESKD